MKKETHRIGSRVMDKHFPIMTDEEREAYRVRRAEDDAKPTPLIMKIKIAVILGIPLAYLITTELMK